MTAMLFNEKQARTPSINRFRRDSLQVATSFTCPPGPCFSYAGPAVNVGTSPSSPCSMALSVRDARRFRMKKIRAARRARIARMPTATPTPTPALAPVLRPLWPTEALASVEVGDAVLLESTIDEDGPEGVWVIAGLVMR